MNPLPTRNRSLALRRAAFRSVPEMLDYAAEGETGVTFFNAKGELLSTLAWREVRERAHVAAQLAIHPVRMILDVERLAAAVGHALGAPVRPREGGLDAVRRVVGEREAHGAGRRDRQQVAVANAVCADRVLHIVGQARCEGAFLEILRGIEERKCAALAGRIRSA